MTIENGPALPTSAAEPKPNSFGRIVGVLTAPTSTFEAIARRPDVLVPLVVLMIFSLLANVLIARNIDFNSITRQAIEDSQSGSSQQMTAEQMDRAVRFGGAIAKAMTYAAPVLQLIVLAAIAGLLLIAFRMFGGEGDYRQAFSIATYSWYPLVINGVIAMIVLLSRKSISVADLRSPVRSNLGFLVDMKTHPFGSAILSSLDVFSFWSIALLIIGFAAMSRLSKGKAAAIVLTYWILYIGVFKMTGAALQTMRMKAS
jgi:hypothetical protein